MKSVSALVMSFTEHVSSNPEDFRDGSRTEVQGQLFTSPGLRIAIEIQRETRCAMPHSLTPLEGQLMALSLVDNPDYCHMMCRIFYCVIVILPIALIVLFAFGMFSMGRAELKVLTF